MRGEQQAGAAFLEDAEADEATLLMREMARVRDRFRNLGYQEGLFHARTAHLQRGFDRGYEMGALHAFCQTFTDNVPISGRTTLPSKQQLSPSQEGVHHLVDDNDHADPQLERLRELYGRIGVCIYDRLQDRLAAASHRP